MVFGVLRICMITTGTSRSAARAAISVSKVNPETSFTISAPASSAASATLLFRVSMEMGISEYRLIAEAVGLTEAEVRGIDAAEDALVRQLAVAGIPMGEFFKLDRRYRQTMSAILGANLVIYFVFIPVALGSLVAGVPLDSAPLIWFRIGLFLWAVVVEATILARALSQPLILGFMFEFLYVLPSLSLSEYFATVPE